MLQRFLLIALTLCSLTASAQWQQTGSKVRYVNGLGIPTKDTAAGVAADSSQILIRPADSSLYVKYKRTWVKVGGGTVSGTPNRVSKFTAATTLGNSSIVDSASAVAMTINPSGNVGIGTITPNQRLDLRGASGLGLQIYETSSGNDNRLILSQIGTESRFTSTFNTGSGLYTWYIGGGELMRLTSSGNLGINQTAPAGRFVVADGQTLLGTNTNNGVDRLQVSGSAIATRLKVNTSGQTVNISNYYNGGGGFNLFINNTEPPLTSTADNNIGIGIDAMISNTSGYYNTGLGVRALQRNTTGYSNVAIGFGALEFQTTGQRNVGIGTNALNSVVSGTDNFGIGAFALQFTTGNKNVAIGSQVMYENTSGSSNIAFGLDAGRRISAGGANQTSNQSIFIGEDTRASAAANTNEMVFGHTAIGQGSNTVTLGNSSITKTFLRGNTMVNTTTDNGVDRLQVNGSIIATALKIAGGTNSQVLYADGSTKQITSGTAAPSGGNDGDIYLQYV
jgi:hypothetical protein